MPLNATETNKTEGPSDKPAAAAKANLTVTQPFLNYGVGAVITSEVEIKVALEKFAHCVVKTAASD